MSRKLLVTKTRLIKFPQWQCEKDKTSGGEIARFPDHSVCCWDNTWQTAFVCLISFSWKKKPVSSDLQFYHRFQHYSSYNIRPLVDMKMSPKPAHSKKKNAHARDQTTNATNQPTDIQSRHNLRDRHSANPIMETRKKKIRAVGVLWIMPLLLSWFRISPDKWTQSLYGWHDLYPHNNSCFRDLIKYENVPWRRTVIVSGTLTM